ncbi:MAG TPA: hypothetical protein VI942_00920, partial [Thermoanaerobaculia bacterium]|nr:hypothetical protein [Thermoanaerobaculia bacterium]
ALDGDRLLARAGADKKAREDGLGWVLLDTAGQGSWDRRIPEEMVRRELGRFLGAGRGRPL